jgi:hypothetical protein
MTAATPWAAQVAAPVRAAPSLLAIGVGVLGLGAGLAAASEAAWSNLLLAAFAVTLAGLAGPLFVALCHVTGGRWAARALPAAYALTSLIPAAGALSLLTLVGAAAIYPWADAERVHGDAILSGREGWMNLPFVALRVALCFAAWWLLARGLLARSRAAFAHGGEAARAAAGRASAVFLVVLAPTFSLLCFDLLLSVEPHWPSTMFALYHVAGLLEGGVALLVLLVLHLVRQGRLADDVQTRHDLGKLLFAFAFFWGYLWYCQYMLIWYTNLPEETSYYAVRHAGAWEPLAVANVILGFGVPFVLLLSRHGKRNAALLGRVAGVAVLARWLDLYVHLQPPLPHGTGLTFPSIVIAIAVAVGAGGLVAYLWKRAYDAQASAP